MSILFVHLYLRDRKMEKALRESEKKFRTIFERANDCMIYLDNFGRIVDVNKKTEEVFGQSKKELRGKHFTNKSLFSPDDIAELMHFFSDIFSGKKSVVDVTVKKNQEKTHLGCSGSLIKRGDKTTGLLVIARDDTKRKEAEEALRKAHKNLRVLNEELEDKVKERTAKIRNLLKQKDDFINQLGHDLKSPLNPIINLLPGVIKKTEDQEAQEMLEVISRNAYYIKELVLDTLRLARLDTASVTLNVKDIVLAEVVDTVLKDNEPTFREEDIETENLIDEEIIVKADELQIKEVLNNLVSNAVKFMEKDGKLTLDVEPDFDEGVVKISVRDTGIGLTEEQAAQVFNEFYKADESRHDRSSAGLGLSICKRIVEKHGGKIWAESQGPGKGTTMFFTLPLALDEHDIDDASVNTLTESNYEYEDVHEEIDKKIDKIDKEYGIMKEV